MTSMLKTRHRHGPTRATQCLDASILRRRQRLRDGRRLWCQRGIAVIDGGCPCMFDPTADLEHKAMRFIFTLKGNVPKEV
jgi:hypothetical protein